MPVGWTQFLSQLHSVFHHQSSPGVPISNPAMVPAVQACATHFSLTGLFLTCQICIPYAVLYILTTIFFITGHLHWFLSSCLVTKFLDRMKLRIVLLFTLTPTPGLPVPIQPPTRFGPKDVLSLQCKSPAPISVKGDDPFSCRACWDFSSTIHTLKIETLRKVGSSYTKPQLQPAFNNRNPYLPSSCQFFPCKLYLEKAWAEVHSSKRE